VITSPEAIRVYIGSFWNQPLLNEENRSLFEEERNELFCEIQHLPKDAAVRKLNDLIKRSRLAKVMLSYLFKLLRATKTKNF